ncbi:MAG: hypothetical protein K6T92_04980, partial [Candidatus Rokubacteria bacterium]|nr:hypothetical protein [Candidatus Rokubacteria bacterium]
MLSAVVVAGGLSAGAGGLAGSVPPVAVSRGSLGLSTGGDSALDVAGLGSGVEAATGPGASTGGAAAGWGEGEAGVG